MVTALALRYFYVTHEWRHNVELQAKARVHALQARIRPHFLFNSMNTIAALTRSNPARAEEAVQDLADLFRANLNEKRNQISLAEEIDVARTYQRMEQLRLGERLHVDWKIDSLPTDALVPGLTLQPLLENAIYHGVEPRPDGGVVTVTGEFNKGMITIVVSNPVPAAEPHHARRQSPGARQHQGTARSHVRRTRDGEVRPFRRSIHRDAAFPVHGDTGRRVEMNLRVLIVDDEPPARERLRSMLAEAGEFEVAGEAGNGEQAIDMVDKLTPDIVLLDVRMPGIDGLEVARHLATLPEPPAVIFTTAFDEYALQAFDSEAVAYLLKPIRAEKLRAALAKAARLTRPQLQQVAAAAREPTHRLHIGVRGRDGLKLIPIEEVFYFQADQKYTTVKHLKGEDLIEDSLKTLEEEFSANFVRIHRNAAREHTLPGAHRARCQRPALRASARPAGCARSQPPHGGRSQGPLPDLGNLARPIERPGDAQRGAWNRARIQPRAEHTAVVRTFDLEHSRADADDRETLRIAGVIAHVDELARMRIEPALHEAQSQPQRAQRQWLERHDLAARGIRNAAPARVATRWTDRCAAAPGRAALRRLATSAVVMPGGGPAGYSMRPASSFDLQEAQRPARQL